MLGWCFALNLMSACLFSCDNDAEQYDQNKPFGFCTMSSRTDATGTYDIKGGGCYTYPVADSVAGVVVLTSNGQDMKNTIEEAIKDSTNRVIIFDGSKGDFIVSSTIKVTVSDKTLLGINNARLCTQWFLTDEMKKALNDAGIPDMSTSGGGGQLVNGAEVKEEAEYNTRRILIEMTGDEKEGYRKAGIFTLSNCRNIIIRNLKLVGPGAVDVGGNDLLSSSGTSNCWVDHCEFTDGLDDNFDITKSSDFHTVSWCTFSYTSRSYMHQNSNLVGSNGSEATGFLNTTYAFNWWGVNCQGRMPMARVGKIHILNNYYSSTVAYNCINPRKNSEFLIEGNYFDKGVTDYYTQRDAVAVTWTSDNYVAEASDMPSSFGATVSVPYDYSVVPAANVPTVVRQHAGATLFRQP